MNDHSAAVTLAVTAVFDELGIAYIIGGSLASAVHGVARMTLDSDLVADVQVEHVMPLVERLETEFYISSDAIIDAVIHRSSFNLIHLASMFKVDVFVAKDRAFEQSQFANRSAVAITSDPIQMAYVASAEDTILAKLEWYRQGGETSDRQWRDVLGILRVQGDRLDREYMAQMALDLGVADLLDRTMRET